MVEKADGAGFRGGGVKVDVEITVDAREPVLSWLRVALPFSLMTQVDLLLEWSCREEMLLAKRVAEPGLAMLFSPTTSLASSMTTSSVSLSLITADSQSAGMEVLSVWPFGSTSPVPLNRFRVTSSSPSEAVRRRRPHSPFAPSASFLRRS